MFTMIDYNTLCYGICLNIMVNLSQPLIAYLGNSLLRKWDIYMWYFLPIVVGKLLLRWSGLLFLTRFEVLRLVGLIPLDYILRKILIQYGNI